MYNFECYTECPVGTISIGKKCQYASNIVPFPFLIVFVVLCIGFGATKFFWKGTDVAGLWMIATGICEVASALATIRILLLDFEVFKKQVTIMAIGLITYVVSNVGFILLYVLRFRND